MRFNLGHPDYPQYAFNLFDVTKKAERHIEALAPVDLVSRALDWPRVFGGFRGWTDTYNSLWWPRDMDQFATCVVVINDAQNDLLASCVAAQKASHSFSDWRWPYLILSARMAPPDNGLPAEGFAPHNVAPVAVETERIGWKLYPQAPINISSLSAEESVRGLWLLPLTDVRYFYRNVPLNSILGGSSGSGAGAGYPIIDISREDTPDWMPPLRGYPQDLSAPLYYSPIADQGTEGSITSATRMGDAADRQALMHNWRIVNRDVRSNYNREDGTFPHNQFTGVLADYPEQWALPENLVDGYHLDAINLLTKNQSRRAGGEADVRTTDDLICRKLQFLFDVSNTDAVYCITLLSIVDYPETTADFVLDSNGPDSTEKKLIPIVHMGVQVNSRTPDLATQATLITAAKKWFLLYCNWRRKQFYAKYPGIYPLIPNGHAAMIRWDFRSTCYETTYIALEGVQATPTDYGRGSGGTGGDNCFLAVLTRKEYASGSPFILYSGIRVIDSDGVTYTLGDAVDLPIYHVQNVDLPVWFDQQGGSTSSSGHEIPEECVARVCLSQYSDHYFIDDQPRIEFVVITGNFDGDTAPGSMVTWDQENDEVAILDPDIRIVDLNALV